MVKQTEGSVRIRTLLTSTVYLRKSKSSIEVTICTSSNILVWFGRDPAEKGVAVLTESLISSPLVGSLKMNTTLEYSTRVVQEGDRRCKKSTLNDLAYLTPLRIPLMNPVLLQLQRD